MRSPTLERLALPAAMGGTLLLSLAYWWLDNLAHELFGTALFMLLGWHLWLNRSWFRNLTRGRYSAYRATTTALHFLLIANMGVLLVTSIIISKTVFAALLILDSITLRDIHWFAAYWVMIIVGIHLGIPWNRVMALTRTRLHLGAPRPIRTLILRVLAVVIAGFGLWSFTVLGVWNKLTFTYSLEFWDFTASVTPFFGHWIVVVALPASLSYYLGHWWKSFH